MSGIGAVTLWWSGTVVAAGLWAYEAMSGTTIAIALSASALLIVLNGLFVAYEFAVVAARRSAFEEDQAGNGPVVRAARASLSDLSMQLAGAQLGITMASLALARIGEPALEAILVPRLDGFISAERAEGVSFALALAIFTFLHLIFGEMVPKNIALTVPETTLRFSVLPYRLYLLVFRPVVWFLNAIANGMARMVGIEPRDEIMSVHTASELSAIVHHSQQGGAIEADDAELLQGALEFAERAVSQIATPLDDYPSVLLGSTAVQLEQVVARSGLHRILVRQPGQQKPIGYLHARDLLEIPTDRRAAPVPAALVRRTAVVDGQTSLIDVLRDLRRSRLHLAVVASAGEEPAVVSVEEVVRALVEPNAELASQAENDHESSTGDDVAAPDPLDLFGRMLSN